MKKTLANEFQRFLDLMRPPLPAGPRRIVEMAFYCGALTAMDVMGDYEEADTEEENDRRAGERISEFQAEIEAYRQRVEAAQNTPIDITDLEERTNPRAMMAKIHKLKLACEAAGYSDESCLAVFESLAPHIATAATAHFHANKAAMGNRRAMFQALLHAVQHG